MAPISSKKRNYSSDSGGSETEEGSSKSKFPALLGGQEQLTQEDDNSSLMKKIRKTTKPEDEEYDEDENEGSKNPDKEARLQSKSPSLLTSSEDHQPILNDRITSAQSHLVKVRAEYQRVKTELVNAEKAYEDACAIAKEHSERDAGALLLLDPNRGHSPEDTWDEYYNLLQEFKQKHGHVDVPVKNGDQKLGLWVRTQLTLYRNGRQGKLPVISTDRIGMLEKLGINWGLKRQAIPWEERYQALLEYKERFGHAHVPWQWKENVALAQWVNTQRKKYKDLQVGKRSNLTYEQIDKLNSIGFKWSTGGKGRYTMDSPSPNAVKPNDTAEAVLCDTSNPLASLRSGNSSQAKSTAASSTVSSDTGNVAANILEQTQPQAQQANRILSGTSISLLSDSPEAAAAVSNLQPSTLNGNQTQSAMAVTMANDLQARLAAAVQAGGIQGNVQSSSHPATERLALQHQLLGQHLIQPQTVSSDGIGAQPQQATNTHLIQQILANNQSAPVELVNHNIMSSSTTQQQLQSHSLSGLSNAYTQLLGRQQQQNQMNLSNAYKQLLNQQMAQQALASNTTASLSQQQPAHDVSAAISTLYQQLQSAQQQSASNNQLACNPAANAPQPQNAVVSNLAVLYQQYLNQQQKK